MDTAQDIQRQRSSLLRRLEAGLELPMAVLGIVWLTLVIVEITGQGSRALVLASDVILGLFIADFAVKFIVAPRKARFLRRNLLSLASLMLPALRALRVARMLRVLRASRGLRLLRLLTSTNQSVRSLGATLRRRGFGYVMALTLFVLLAGAAGILALEGATTHPGSPIGNYGDALWWAAMLLVTVGSDYWPHTPEGRLLCLLLALYGFSIFGYVTATLGSYFIQGDSARSRGKG